MTVRHEPPSFRELLLIAILATVATIAVALSIGCGHAAPLIGASEPATEMQAWMLGRVQHYALVKSVAVEVRFASGADVRLSTTWALDPVTQKRYLLPSAGWVGCVPRPPVPIFVNADDLERGNRDFYNRIAAHEVCHVALHHECMSESEAIEAAANACAVELEGR